MWFLEQMDGLAAKQPMPCWNAGEAVPRLSCAGRNKAKPWKALGAEVAIATALMMWARSLHLLKGLRRSAFLLNPPPEAAATRS